MWFLPALSESVLSTMLILREFWSTSDLHFSLGTRLEGYLLIHQGGKLQE